jgi:hypothetical protein
MLKTLAGEQFTLNLPLPTSDPVVKKIVIAGPRDLVSRAHRDPEYKKRLARSLFFYVDFTRFEVEDFQEGKIESTPIRWFIDDREFQDFTVREIDPTEAAFTITEKK